ncbi:unnamed protein product [Staurois parvus]|uniref:Uncharacterized protein n=1 Tax=Staurois parvus TaxID=386267 RepID=A0ABN9B4Y7_9NEOB|nr:unnamed protein product [Staurois parvus]
MGENVCASYGANMGRPALYSRRRRVRIAGPPLGSTVQKEPAPRSYLFLGPEVSSRLLSLAPASSLWVPGCDSLQLHSRVPTAHDQEALCFGNGPVVFWDLSCVPQDYREVGQLCVSGSGYLLWSSPVLCLQSLVISCTMSAVSDHLLYYVRISGHLL